MEGGWRPSLRSSYPADSLARLPTRCLHLWFRSGVREANLATELDHQLGRWNRLLCSVFILATEKQTWRPSLFASDGKNRFLSGNSGISSSLFNYNPTPSLFSPFQTPNCLFSHPPSLLTHTWSNTHSHISSPTPNRLPPPPLLTTLLANLPNRRTHPTSFTHKTSQGVLHI